MSYMWEDILMLGSDLSEGNARAARSQYVYHFFPTSQTLSGHTSITIGLQTKNSAAIKMGHRAPAQIRSEFFVVVINLCDPNTVIIEEWPF